MKTLPCIVTIGLSGAGKSTSNEWMERNYAARRVRRFTTRPVRSDDDSRLVVHRDYSVAEANAFVYYGWGNTIYWILESDIQKIQKEKLSPLVELGDAGDAIKFKERFKPAFVVCLWRNLAFESMRNILLERKMGAAEIEQRVLSFQTDLSDLHEKSSQFDFNIYNNEDKDVLFDQWKMLLRKLSVAKR